MNFTPLTDEHNKDLCALESTILMLKIANMQYRRAQECCSEGTIRYFSEKNDVYAELREGIYSEIWEDYYLDELNFSKRLELSKNSLWRKFQREFPECKLSFDEVFVDGECVYEPFKQAQQNVIMGKAEATEKMADLTELYAAFQSDYINYYEFLNFKTLLFQINAQVTESGTKPWLEPTLDGKVAYVPIWAVEEFFDSAQTMAKQVKKDYVKFGVKYVKAQRNTEKHPDNPELKVVFENCQAEHAMYASRVDNLEDMVLEGDHIYERVGARTQKWATVEIGSVIFEKIREFFTDIPDEVKTLTPTDTLILSLKSEIANMVHAGILELPTMEASLVLGMYAGVDCKLELSNYEYSKKVIATLLENLKDNVPERLRLLEENKTATPKKIAENNHVIMQIEDCAKAIHYISFETPFGEVKIKNGKLVNVKTGQVYDVSELDKYRVVDGKVVLNELQPSQTHLQNQGIVGGKK